MTQTIVVAPRRLPMIRAVCRRTEFQVGLVLVALVVGLAMVGPLLAPYTATEFVAIPFSDS